MKLQPESKKELLRIACGVSLCTAVMWVVFAALHLVGWVAFDYRVLLGGIIGALVAIGNFAGICFVVQKVIDEPDEKKRKAQLQISYNTAAGVVDYHSHCGSLFPGVCRRSAAAVPQSYDLLSPDNREVQAAHTPAGAGGHRCGR